ncbi:MAG: DNA recombination protein RmuC [Clostridia bacterium]
MDLNIIIYILSGICFLQLLALIVIARSKKDSKNISNEFSMLKQDMDNKFRNTREELNNTLGGKIVDLTNLNENKLENIRKAVEDKLSSIQRDNSEKLEKMRQTVDEKLHNTLEQRLGESFKLVNERLESVYKGLGEMQTLAVGVGDLKKVFTNVKSRGYWGEIQLGNILEQFLTPEQYICSAKTKPNSNDFVEFAVKIPSKENGEFILLPVDSKFPVEDYQRLLEAEELGDADKIKASQKSLGDSIKKFAQDIHDKYIEPPYTTDFGIMFLPTESLFCEVLRNTELCELLQQKYRVTITGPTTFIALLNSLQMGFRTLAIEKRSSEVWQLLGNVKSEFGKFGDLLDKTNKKLVEISNTMVSASRKTRTIERKLKNVETLPIDDESSFYMLQESADAEENTVDSFDEE